MVFMPGPMLCHLPPVGKPRRPRYKFVSGTAVLCLSGTMMGAILALALPATGCLGARFRGRYDMKRAQAHLAGPLVDHESTACAIEKASAPSRSIA